MNEQQMRKLSPEEQAELERLTGFKVSDTGQIVQPEAKTEPEAGSRKMREGLLPHAAALGTRVVGGVASGIVGAVPSFITTPLAGAIGGGAEALAQNIESSDPVDYSTIGLEAGLSAVPLGKVYKAGSKLANMVRGVGLMEAGNMARRYNQDGTILPDTMGEAAFDIGTSAVGGLGGLLPAKEAGGISEALAERSRKMFGQAEPKKDGYDEILELIDKQTDPQRWKTQKPVLRQFPEQRSVPGDAPVSTRQPIDEVQPPVTAVKRARVSPEAVDPDNVLRQGAIIRPGAEPKRGLAVTGRRVGEVAKGEGIVANAAHIEDVAPPVPYVDEVVEKVMNRPSSVHPDKVGMDGLISPVDRPAVKTVLNEATQQARDIAAAQRKIHEATRKAEQKILNAERTAELQDVRANKGATNIGKIKQAEAKAQVGHVEKEAVQDARNLNARDKVIAADQVQDAKNLNARDKFIANDQAQTAKNLNIAQETQTKIDTETAAKSKIDALLESGNAQVGPRVLTESTVSVPTASGKQTLKQSIIEKLDDEADEVTPPPPPKRPVVPPGTKKKAFVPEDPEQVARTIYKNKDEAAEALGASGKRGYPEQIGKGKWRVQFVDETGEPVNMAPGTVPLPEGAMGDVPVVPKAEAPVPTGDAGGLPKAATPEAPPKAPETPAPAPKAKAPTPSPKAPKTSEKASKAPFKTRKEADAAAKASGGKVTRVKGGFKIDPDDKPPTGGGKSGGGAPSKAPAKPAVTPKAPKVGGAKAEAAALPPRTPDTMNDAISISSPSGKVSGKAATAAKDKLGKALFGEKGLPKPTAVQPTEIETLRRQAAELRDLAAKGQKPKAYVKKAEELEAKANQLETPHTIGQKMGTGAAKPEAIPAIGKAGKETIDSQMQAMANPNARVVDLEGAVTPAEVQNRVINTIKQYVKEADEIEAQRGVDEKGNYTGPTVPSVTIRVPNGPVVTLSTKEQAVNLINRIEKGVAPKAAANTAPALRVSEEELWGDVAGQPVARPTKTTIKRDYGSNFNVKGDGGTAPSYKLGLPVKGAPKATEEVAPKAAEAPKRARKLSVDVDKEASAVTTAPRALKEAIANEATAAEAYGNLKDAVKAGTAKPEQLREAGKKLGEARSALGKLVKEAEDAGQSVPSFAKPKPKEPVQGPKRAVGRPRKPTATEPPAKQAETLKKAEKILEKGRLKNQKGQISTELLLNAGLSVTGATAGMMANPDDPIMGAMVGGSIGMFAPTAYKVLMNRLQSNPHPTSIKQVGEWTKDKVVTFAQMLPDYYRASALTSVNLPVNAFIGPYGSGLFGAIEHALSGDPRGMRAVKTLLFSPKFLKEYAKSWKEADEVIKMSASRAEGGASGAGPELFQQVTSWPAQVLTAGDVAIRKVLMDAGFPEPMARTMTLTSEPFSPPGVGIGNMRKSEGRLNEKKSWLMQMLLPFYRTKVNQMEQGLVRFPVIGPLIAKGWKETPIPLQQTLVRQAMNIPIVGGAYLIGASTPEENQKTALKVINNFGGQYGLQASMAFAAGVAAQKGDPIEKQVIKAVKSMILDSPLPTTDLVTDVVKMGDAIIDGKPIKLPYGTIPAIISSREKASIPSWMVEPESALPWSDKSAKPTEKEYSILAPFMNVKRVKPDRKSTPAQLKVQKRREKLRERRKQLEGDN